MKKIYIYGLGKGNAFVERCLKRENSSIVGYIDNFKTDIQNKKCEIPVIRQQEIIENYDYIIVSIMQFEDIKHQLLEQGIEQRKVVCFFDFNDAEKEEYWEFIDAFKWREELMWKHYREITMPTIENINYEIYGESDLIKKTCPNIIGVDETVDILSRNQVSLTRFGDGEFEIMCGRKRPVFQCPDKNLQERLKEVLHSNVSNLLVAIADNYSSLDKYTDDAAQTIRSYLKRSVRRDHMQLLEVDRQYYDAYISRPYIMYRDKVGAEKRFANIRRIWERENVLVVEGKYTRFGVGNDLLDNTASIQRILVPDKNAFSEYDKILETTRQYGKNKLILTSIGPTATVLAYDLAKEGYWVIDIGQLDVEYEWYLRRAGERCNIPYKRVSEVAQYEEIVTDQEEDFIKKYLLEIVADIS